MHQKKSSLKSATPPTHAALAARLLCLVLDPLGLIQRHQPIGIAVIALAKVHRRAALLQQVVTAKKIAAACMSIPGRNHSSRGRW